MSKILFHICCGPCATASIKKLQSEGYEVVGYYYNPNIHPKGEYKKRLAEAKKLAERVDFELIVPEYNESEYFEAIRGFEDNKEERCPKCWEQRLIKTAQKTVEMGIKCFGTTLRISPYQNQEELMRLGQKIAADFGLTFYAEDLVTCFRESVALSKDQEMYRQKYCGCAYSLKESQKQKSS